MPSASTPTSYSSTTLVKATASVLVLGVADDKVLGLDTAKSARTAAEEAVRAIEFSGKAGSTARIAAPKGFSAKSILLVGLGAFDAAAHGTDAAAKSHEVLRRAA
ncbi:MAG: leucyl aminopeptidase, partial [Brevibacterium sp.]|nr:leucyl aminopeptidase [Brevibacterium sp.]